MQDEGPVVEVLILLVIADDPSPVLDPMVRCRPDGDLLRRSSAPCRRGG